MNSDLDPAIDRPEPASNPDASLYQPDGDSPEAATPSKLGETPVEDSRSYLVYYGEVGLKKGNRPHFEASLVRNMYYGVQGLQVTGIHRLFGRLRVDQRSSGDARELENRLSRIPGIVHFEPVERFGWDLEPVEAKLAQWADEGGFESFAIRCRRLQKSYPLRSQELMVRLGSLVNQRSKARVDLTNPAQEFHVLILNKEIFLHRRRIDGPRGLPIGTAGRVLHMLSGGIDSPVAAERLLRRGCHVQFIHFHSSPFTDRSSVEKVTELAELLSEHRMLTKLHLVPLGVLQRKIVADAPAKWRVMLYRRFMLRFAERIARQERCIAIGSGESLAQVASQTLANLGVLDSTVDLPLLRPLLTYEKDEIIQQAQKLGTFEISIEPHSDCCGYLLPRNPVTSARLHEIEEVEDALDVRAEFGEVLDNIEVVSVGEDRSKSN